MKSPFPLTTPTPVPPRRIGFDFDCVIADTAAAFLDIVCRDYGFCGHTLEEITSFNVSETLAIPEELIRSIFMGLEAEPSSITPVEGALPVLERLAKTGIKPAIVTARKEEEPLRRWLDMHLSSGVEVDDFRIACSGDHDGKLAHLQRFGLTHFVDDRAETCQALAEEGMNTIVFSRPWNRGQHSCPQVANWQEIEKIIDWSTS